jgi:aryl-alcohol dehydrogenase-like predicted oxidoreductase
MKFLDTDIAPLGLGCWPIGGKMFAEDGQSLGYANADDKESLRAIHAALANGITLFDTAAAYGAGHSEHLLAKGLKNKLDAVVVTKIGFSINEATKVLTGPETDPASVEPAIERCLKRLDRESIDLVLLHLNDLPLDKAGELFDEMEKVRQRGKIKAYGWSTDYVANVEAMHDREGFTAVEHAMNVFMDAPKIQSLVHGSKLHALIRSPLAMGLLSGKYTNDSTLSSNDVRATNQGWAQYYIDGKPNPTYIELFNAVRELLQTGGRTSAQGALSWLWAKSSRNIPIPGARTVKQVEELASALTFGALPTDTMEEIAKLIGREFESDGASDR